MLFVTPCARRCPRLLSRRSAIAVVVGTIVVVEVVLGCQHLSSMSGGGCGAGYALRSTVVNRIRPALVVLLLLKA
eukprot:6178903-Pleurochrysis_carterae.AAC.1